MPGEGRDETGTSGVSLWRGGTWAEMKGPNKQRFSRLPLGGGDTASTPACIREHYGNQPTRRVF